MASIPLAIYQPRTLEQALTVLDSYGEDAMVIAGGTALTIMLRHGLVTPRALVSIDGLPDLNAIDVSDGLLKMGALVTHRQVEVSPVVHRHLPVVAETFGKVANVRVRNAATVGGVMAEADYASDPPTLLMALDAEVHISGPSGARVMPVSEFFVSFYETVVRPNEIVTSVRVPLLPDEVGVAYIKYVTRSSEDRPCLGTAAVVKLADDGRRCTELRVAVGAASATPQRLPEIDALAVGEELTEELIASVADRYAESVSTLDDMRGSAQYRTEMIRVWVRRTIEKAWQGATASR